MSRPLGEDIELAGLPRVPSPTSAFDLSAPSEQDANNETVGKQASDATSPLLTSSTLKFNEPEGSNHPNASLLYLRRIAELCEKILESNLRREKRLVPDVENKLVDEDQVPQPGSSIGFRKISKDPSDVAKMKLWKYEEVTVMTPDEMRASPSWEDQASDMLLDDQCTADLERWVGPAKDAFPKSSPHNWLLLRLGLLSIKARVASGQRMWYPVSRNYALLICYRLDTYSLHSGIPGRTKKSDFLLIRARIMIMIITLTSFRGGSSLEDYTVGGILVECYRRGLLEQPTYDHPGIHTDHFYFVVHPFLILATEFCKYDRFGHPNLHNLRLGELAYERMMGLTLYDILQRCDDETPIQSFDRATGSRFRADDLDVSSLRSVGRLNVEWTACLKEHLSLDIQARTIKICWFPARLDGWVGDSYIARWYSTVIKLYCGSLSKNSVRQEMTASYAFLFATESFKRDPRTLYQSLPRPYWIAGKYPITSAQDLDVDIGTHPQFEVTTHIVACKAVGGSGQLPLAYSDFPGFESRLRELRAYMDSCRPTGIRGLWRDNRDSLNYYTFWGVIIFGLASVLLALLSLAVSTAQTVASFKALDSTYA